MYSSMYSDVAKAEDAAKTASSYYSSAAGAPAQTAEAYYAQQEAIQIMQQQQQEYEKQAAAYHKRKERSRSPEPRKERSYEDKYRRRSPSPKYRSSRDHEKYESSSSKYESSYYAKPATSMSYHDQRAMEKLFEDYQCSSIYELREKLKRSPENRAQEIVNENMKKVYLTMVSNVQDTCAEEMKKLAQHEVLLVDEINKCGGRVPSGISGGSLHARLGKREREDSEKPRKTAAHDDPEVTRRMDQLQRDLEDEVAAKKELKRDLDKVKKERDESKKRAESYKSDYMACYEDLKLERAKTKRLMEENAALKGGSVASVKSESSVDQLNSDLMKKNSQMQKEIELQREQLKNMDKALGAKENSYNFDIPSDDENSPAKKAKVV